MRSHDRMALVKMVQQYSSGQIKSPAGVVMLVRLAAKVLDEDVQMRTPMYNLLEGWLRHKAEMVNFEAAKAICEIKDVTDAEVAPAINGMYCYLIFIISYMATLHRFVFSLAFPPNIMHKLVISWVGSLAHVFGCQPARVSRSQAEYKEMQGDSILPKSSLDFIDTVLY